MKYSEISNLQVQELRKRLVQSRQALFDAKMKHKMQRLSNMMELRNVRRDIARLETALSSLPASAFVSDKKKDPVKAEAKVKKAVKPKEKVKAQVKKTKEPVKKATSAAAPSKEKTAPDKSKEVKKPVQKTQEKKAAQKDGKKWFGFLGSKKQSGGDRKSAVGKKRMFRRKSN